MPVFNGLRFLRGSIESILNQTHEDFEFIILDDCSEEPVWDLIQNCFDSRIVALRNSENIGLTKSLNICLDKVRGDFVVRHDSDDISLSTRIEEQLKYFEEGVGFVGSWAEGINEKGLRIKTFVDTYCRCSDDDLITEYPEALCMADPTSIYHIEAVRKVGYFDERMYLGQTYNYNRRVQGFFRGRVVPKILYQRREWVDQVGKRFKRFIFKERGMVIDWESLANKFACEKLIIKERQSYPWEKE